jgi:hypothetical protein
MLDLAYIKLATGDNTQKVEVTSSFLRSIKNYPSATEGIFRFSWIMFSTDAKIRAGFTSSLASRAPRSKADFSTLKGEIKVARFFVF